MPSRQTSTTISDCLVDGSSSSAAPLQATQTDTHDVLGLPEQRMPPRQTPTTFPDRLGDGCCTPPPPENATQTDIHDVLRLLGGRKLLFCSSIACHQDRLPRRFQTAWSTETPLLQLHCMPPRQTATTFSDCLSNECHPDRHPRRFRTAWATDVALLHLRKMQPRQTSTTFSDCLGDRSSSSAVPLHATQTDFHNVLRLLGRRKLLFCSSIACHPDRHPRRSRTA